MKKLSEITDFYEYLDGLAEIKECLIMVAVCDTMTVSAQKTNITTDGYAKLARAGVRELRYDNAEKQFWSGYAALLQGGKAVYEELAPKNNNAEYKTDIEDHKIHIFSSPYKNMNKAAIIIDGNNYAVGLRGLNFLVCDLKKAEIVDSVCFDTWKKDIPAVRTSEVRAGMSLKEEAANPGKHYDVGIMGVWSGCNYGSIATYYALNKTIESMGKSVLMIDKPSIVNEDKELTLTHSRIFANEHYNISKSYKLSELKELNRFCDAFVLGSDQLWNYGISKNFGKSYYLDYPDPGKKKIAYGTSFGHGRDFAPPNERVSISNYMKDFDAISVRESDGVRLCRDVYGVKAVQVLDPVFLADKKIFDELAEKSAFREEEKYIATYILDPTPENVRLLKNVSQRLGYKLVNILDGLPWLFKKNQEKLGLPAIENVHVEEWLYVIKNCEFLITDSCHGASFGIIFNKNMIALTNAHRGISRFNSLAELFDIRDHIITNPLDGIDNDLLLQEIDYKAVNAKLKTEKERCYRWLYDALTLPKEKLPSVLLPENTVNAKLERKMCTGCAACVSACPVNAIKLKPDRSGYYRSKIDYDKCVNCGQCVKVCPAIALPDKTNFAEPDCYAFVAQDRDLLYKSSSGGIFPLLAKQVLEAGGLVAGAAWKDDFTAAHMITDSPEGLEKLKKSKYFQSYMGDINKQIKKALDEGRKVLFSGCPCQVAGLKKYLGKEYPGLILVDLLCGNAPSAGFFRKYLDESFPEGVKDYQFRYKKQGWNADCLTLTLTLTDGTKIERRGASQDIYQKAYHSHLLCPEHCENCQYQQAPRFGDITIGDFWGYSKRDPSVDTREGISVVLCNNEKGRNFFAQLPKSQIRIKKKVPFSWLGGNGYALPGKHNWKSPHRDKFYELIETHSFSESVRMALESEEEPKGRPLKDFAPLQYDSYSSHFIFDGAFWEEHSINGKITLLSLKEKAVPGKMACLPFRSPLKKGNKYKFKIRFKANTDSKTINLHVVNTASPKEKLQIIKSVHSENGFANKWIEDEIIFTAKADYLNAFAIGALQFGGANAYFMMDHILITELKE